MHIHLSTHTRYVFCVMLTQMKIELFPSHIMHASVSVPKL